MIVSLLFLTRKLPRNFIKMIETLANCSVSVLNNSKLLFASLYIGKCSHEQIRKLGPSEEVQMIFSVCHGVHYNVIFLLFGDKYNISYNILMICTVHCQAPRNHDLPNLQFSRSGMWQNVL